MTPFPSPPTKSPSEEAVFVVIKKIIWMERETFPARRGNKLKFDSNIDLEILEEAMAQSVAELARAKQRESPKRERPGEEPPDKPVESKPAEDRSEASMDLIPPAVHLKEPKNEHERSAKDRFVGTNAARLFVYIDFNQFD
eukprot:Skav201793  [mRNA]  locus=scaffold645:47860:49920:+ [translate_table: standard]